MQNYNSYFKHLQIINQTYCCHFCDCMCYSWSSLKSSFYFFLHGIYPDIFQHNGSETILELNDKIRQKYSKT